MSASKKRSAILIGGAVFALLAGGAWWYGNGTKNTVKVDRPSKSIEDLLHDLKKYGHSGTREKAEQTHEALIALGPPIVPRLREALGETGRFERGTRIRVVLILGEIGDPSAADTLMAMVGDPGSVRVPQVVEAIKKVGYENIDQLLSLLKSPDESVQRCATEVLGRLGDDRAVEPLLELFHNGSEVIRRWVVGSLASIGDRRAVAPLIEALRECEDANLCYSLCGALGRLGDPRAVEPLIAAMERDPESRTRIVVVALGRLGDQRAVGTLVNVLNTSDHPVRETAIKALGNIGGEEAAQALVDVMKASSNQLRNPSKGYNRYTQLSHLFRNALAAMGSSAVELLIAELNDPSSPIREEAAMTLGQIGDRRAVEPLAKVVADRDIAHVALTALGEIGGPRATEVIVAALERDNSSATGALTSLNPPPVKLLCKALKHRRPNVRRSVAYALGEVGDPSTLQPLIDAYQCEDSKHGQIRQYLLRAIGEIGKPETIDLLIDATKDDEREVRRAAVVALGTIGDRRAVPSLIKVLEDQWPLAVESAARMLGEIGDPRAVKPLVKLLARQGQSTTYVVCGDDYSGEVTRRRHFWEHSQAEGALIKIGGPSVGPLLGALKGPSANARCGAIRVLGYLGDRRAVKPLIEIVQDSKEDKEIRRLAVVALGEIGDGQAVGPLLKIAAKKFDPKSTKNPAPDALWALGMEAIDPLIAALDDENAAVRKEATRALKSIGHPRALQAIEDKAQANRKR